MENGEWNMQYFGTAQGAVCTALHSLLLQERGSVIMIFPALPKHWNDVSFNHLLVNGCVVSASYTRKGSKIEGSLKNITNSHLAINLKVGDEIRSIHLIPEKEYVFHSAN
jgi:hypothetical protein